jgi:hypothetical protein
MRHLGNLISIYSVFFCIHVNAQYLSTATAAALPSGILESSGIESLNDSTFWTHNDSGGSPELYELDMNGNLMRTLAISNAGNVDWEDITADENGNIYIGDFGNNYNTRTDLKIYVINHPDSISGSSTTAQIINFTFSDQTAFPPANENLNYDIETIIWFNDSLYLFSKNRSIPYSGYTKYYRLPALAGTFTAELVDSFYGGSGSAWDYQVCGGDISKDGKQLFLLSHDKAWIFSCFNGSDFFSGSMKIFNLYSNTQKEGICYVNDSALLITDENSYGSGGFLYLGNLGDWSVKPFVDLGNDTTINDSITLDAANNECSYYWNTGDTTQQITIDTSGIYSVIVTAPNGCEAFDSIQLSLPVISELDQIIFNDFIEVIPNPASDYLIIKSSSKNKIIELSVLDNKGRIIHENIYGNEIYDLDISNYPSGFYYLRMITNDQRLIYEKIIKI